MALIPDVTYIHHRRHGSIMTDTGREEYLRHHGITFKEIAEQISTNDRMEDTLRWLPDFCHCYIDAFDNPDYKYAYQVFKHQLSDGHHKIAVWKLNLVNTMSKSPIGRVVYKGNVWVSIQLQRFKSFL